VPATSFVSARPARSQPDARLRLLVELDPAAENAMLRVLTVLARRRCTVAAVAYVHDPEAKCDLLRVEVDTPRPVEPNVVAWISALVPVLGVRPA